MIIDTIDRLSLYESILPQAKTVAALLEAGNPDGAPFEVRIKEYDTKPDSKRRFEVHAHTIDLMIAFSGEEIIHVCPQQALDPAEPLPNGADGRKMNGGPQGSAVLLRAGTFVALYPGEAHMVGGQTAGCAAPIRKWVVKLPVNP
ncbi:MAG: YhcH/YjgK/YiaL family protein [Clostridia bacterium]|nr:YhcH/YjgK/YiaL family protein [Clostridia bacterium]